jgi:hypothetical protein
VAESFRGHLGIAGSRLEVQKADDDYRPSRKLEVPERESRWARPIPIPRCLSIGQWTSVKATGARFARLAEGRYVMKLHAVDKVGNRQSGWTKAKLTVR